MDSRLEQSRMSLEQLIRLQERTGSVTRTWGPLEGCPPARPESLMGAPQQPGAAMNYKPGGRWGPEESIPTSSTLINHLIHGGGGLGPAVSAGRCLMSVSSQGNIRWSPNEGCPNKRGDRIGGGGRPEMFQMKPG